MKKPLLLPFIALVGGAAAAVLRLLQNTTGFEEGTGLPIPGNLPATPPISPPGIPVCCLCPWQACS